jgi:hypothetical protein
MRLKMLNRESLPFNNHRDTMNTEISRHVAAEYESVDAQAGRKILTTNRTLIEH